MDGARLRSIARLLALAGDLGGDGPVLAGALLASLAGLAIAVAELRQAQQHAAQAAAARQTVEHMHEAMVRAGALVPWPGQAARPQRAQSWQADATSRDFPMGLRLDPAAFAAASAASVPRPGRGYQPGKRAGPGR